MNVPELKLPSSTSAVDSVSTSEEEADKDNDGDDGGSKTGSSSKSKTNLSSTDDTEAEEPQELPTTPQEKLTEHHAKNYFNSTMGGKDLRVLFAMAIGCHSRDIPDHKEPPFSQSKVYHSEVKPDASTLKLEVTRRWKAYKTSGRQPRPSNWKIDKCIEYLMENSIPTTEIHDLDWLESELKEWKGIQEMVNESQQREDDRILHRTWSTDIPYLRLYHTLIEDNIRLSLGEAFATKTREQLDGQNSNLFKSFYEKAAERFNDTSWIPNSLVLPDLHEDFNRSRPLPLNVAPISPEQFQKKLSDNRYKMVKVIADWERSGSGRGMINNLVDDGDETEANMTEARVYEFIDGDDRKSFLRERPPHVLYLWHIAYTYDILHTVRQQLRNECISEGSHAPSVSSIKRKKSPESNDPSVTTTNLSDNIQQIADSINGLVGVAKQSQTNQQIDFLHRRRKELEDTICVLDSACVELELKILEETGKRRLVYKKHYQRICKSWKVRKKNWMITNTSWKSSLRKQLHKNVTCHVL